MERPCIIIDQPYFEASGIRNQQMLDPCKRRQGGITKTFPIKLHSMLQDIETEGTHSDIISWNSKGNSFVIRKPHEFTKFLLPNYFRTSKFSSFQRQLNAYGFTRFNLYACQQDVHVYRHKIFHRDHAERLKLIRRKSSLDSNLSQPLIEERIIMNSGGFERGKSFANEVDNYASFKPCLHLSLKNLKSEFYELKDLILDEVAAACLDEDSDFPHASSDALIMYWNPALEKLSNDSDDEHLF
jgi:HSF-type DNA-binding